MPNPSRIKDVLNIGAEPAEDVDKDEFALEEEAGQITVYQDASELLSVDASDQREILVASPRGFFTRAAGSTAAADGDSVLHDAVGNRFHRQLFVGGIVPLAMHSGRFSDGEMLPALAVTTPLYFLAGLSGSRAFLDAAPAAEAVFEIRKNMTASAEGALVGTITFAIGETEGAFAAAEDFTLLPGDTVRLVAPDPKDATLLGLSATLMALGTST